jgi:hypothetical protein
MSFKNSISAQLPAVPLEPSVRILRPHPARVLPLFQRGAALSTQNKHVNRAEPCHPLTKLKPMYGSGILDPKFCHPGSRIRIKEFKYFNPKKFFLALVNMIRVVHPGSGSWFFTHPRSPIQGSKRHRIPDPPYFLKPNQDPHWHGPPGCIFRRIHWKKGKWKKIYTDPNFC